MLIIKLIYIYRLFAIFSENGTVNRKYELYKRLFVIFFDCLYEE